MKQLTAYFFKNKVEKSSQNKKTFQVPSDQIRLLKRFKDKYLIKNTFLHYIIF